MLRRSLLISGLAFFLVAHPKSYAAIVKQIRTQDMQTENGLAAIYLPKGHTVNLSFIKANEVIRQVRIDDRRKVILSFDSPLCSGTPNAAGGCQGGASVIYLRQLTDSIGFSPNESAAYRSSEGNPATALTVITTTAVGQRKIYNFELQLATGSTAPRTIEMVGGGGSSAYISAPLTPSSAPHPPASSASQVTLIRQGLAKAYAQNLVAIDSPVRLAMKSFIQAIDAGKSLDAAIAQSEIPQEFLDWLQTLANN
jgi:hypothetical protein